MAPPHAPPHRHGILRPATTGRHLLQLPVPQRGTGADRRVVLDANLPGLSACSNCDARHSSTTHGLHPFTSVTTPAPPLAPPTTRCPNCGTRVVAWLPASCSRCGFHVIHRDPLWHDRPLSWTKRILLLGWPVIGTTIGISLEDARGGLGAIAVTIGLVCLPAGFVYPPLMLFPVSRRPPLFSAHESAERAASRRRRTVGLTVALGLLIPVLHFALLAFSIGRYR